MTGKRVMGIDYGDARIGIAVSDAMGWTAQGVETIHRKNEEADLNRISELIRQYDVGTLVLGFPKNMNGTIGPRGELSQQFAELLKEKFGLPVILWDERLSTMAAERMLLSADVSRKKRKQVVDKMAAAIILQNYLDSKPQK
jgi:putative Holliday junction resolvase